MVVLKFGGTSVGSAARMGEVLSILQEKSGNKIVVLSAMSGATNDLVIVSEHIKSGDTEAAKKKLADMNRNHEEVIQELSLKRAIEDKTKDSISGIFALLEGLINNPYTINNERIILAQGELISTQLFLGLCQNHGVSASIIPALDFMRIDENGEPASEEIRSLLDKVLNGSSSQVLITQGYICKNHRGEIDNLQRGGSDYTATIIGAVCGATEIQIWTDIDGFHNNDPRIVKDTQPIRKLSYREAAELAYFGAKILHPTCVLPAEKAGIPIRLKCTMKPNAAGTLISHNTSEKPITALAAKDNITAIKIYSHRMLNAYGFLRKVFQVFEDHHTPVDMITTSEVAVSLTIDDISSLKEIVNQLEPLGEVEVEDNHSIVCIVGNSLYQNESCLKLIFDAVGDIPIRMVSMGGSKYNISLLVQTKFKSDVLTRLNALFQVPSPVII